MRVRIQQNKSIQTGRTSLVLDIELAGKRTKKALGLYFKTKPTTEADRKERKEKLALAKRIALEKERELITNRHDIPEQYQTEADFLAYAWNYIAAREGLIGTGKHIAAVRKFQVFLKRKSIPCYEINEALLRRYVLYLQLHLNGESPHNYFEKLSQIIKAATEELYFRRNPTRNITVRRSSYFQKEVLTAEELRLLWQTPCERAEIKRAFLFCCLTGLRWCDVKRLQPANIKGATLHLVQKKTKVALTIPLREEALLLLQEQRQGGERLFHLPTYTNCMLWLGKWKAVAGIEKHLTWHCGRHSYGTLLVSNGVDISIASKLLGHTSLAHTQRYVRVSETLKKEAIEKIPRLINS